MTKEEKFVEGVEGRGGGGKTNTSANGLILTDRFCSNCRATASSVFRTQEGEAVNGVASDRHATSVGMPTDARSSFHLP